ncbi:MAG: hypothetical protein M3Y28_03235 [Armatimonadota bacterium]|nr:hypothetical protein [Armatimonadota bacterium]
MPKQTVAEELELLRDAVEDLTGLPSRWSGHVVLLDSAQMEALNGRPILAQKRWICDIVVNTGIVEQPSRWRTYLHEILHSVSVGTNEADLRRFRGWEEGVVEWWQRRLRPQVLSRIQISVPETTFSPLEVSWPYNPYLEALHVLQQASGVEDQLFYVDLLRIPLAERLAYTRSLNKSADYYRLFASVIGRLR